MEQQRFFLWINRVNSVLFLLLLLAALVLTVIAVIESNDWSERRSVKVMDKKGEVPAQEKFSLGGIENICGYDAKYVALQSERKSAGYSSGSSSQTRNLIFFTGNNRQAHWLFDTNRYLIDSIRVIPSSYSGCEDAKASLIYYDVIKQDTNGDGRISDEDVHTLAISDPTGGSYRELVVGATKVLDFEFDEEKKQINLLLQLGNKIVLRDYSLQGKLLSESKLTALSGR